MHVFVKKTGVAGSRTAPYILVNAGIHVQDVLDPDKTTVRPVLETQNGSTDNVNAMRTGMVMHVCSIQANVIHIVSAVMDLDLTNVCCAFPMQMKI